jgi:hypothetical protein
MIRLTGESVKTLKPGDSGFGCLFSELSGVDPELHQKRSVLFMVELRRQLVERFLHVFALALFLQLVEDHLSVASADRLEPSPKYEAGRHALHQQRRIQMTVSLEIRITGAPRT